MAEISGAEISAGAVTFAEEGIDACPPRPKVGRALRCKESLDASANSTYKILERTRTIQSGLLICHSTSHLSLWSLPTKLYQVQSFSTILNNQHLSSIISNLKVSQRFGSDTRIIPSSKHSQPQSLESRRRESERRREPDRPRAIAGASYLL